MINKSFFGLFLFLFIFTSCRFYAPEFKSLDKIELLNEESKTKRIAIGLTLYNPNSYGIKIKRGRGELFIQNKKIGAISFDDKIKLKAKKENKVDTKINYELEKNILLKLTPLLIKDSVELKIHGNLNGGVWMFSKNNEFTFSEKVNPKGFVQSLIKQ